MLKHCRIFGELYTHQQLELGWQRNIVPKVLDTHLQKCEYLHTTLECHESTFQHALTESPARWEGKMPLGL